LSQKAQLENAKELHTANQEMKANKTRIEKETRHAQSNSQTEGFKQKRAQRLLEEVSEKEAIENYKLQSEMKKEMSLEREKYDREQRSQMAQIQTDNFRQNKLQRSMEEVSQKSVLENSKHQSEMQVHMRAEREKYDREQRSQMAQIQTDGFKQNKLQRSMEDVSQRSALENSKHQSEMQAHMKDSRLKREKEQRHEASAMRTEGFRQVKQQRSFVDESQRELLENDRVQAELTAHLREEREKYDKELRHGMAQIKADAFKNNKAQRSLEDLSQKAQLENAKIQYEQLAYSRARRNSTEREQRREVNRIKAESLRQDATEKRAKHRAQQGTIRKETFDADDIQPETLNQLLTSAGLKQYLTVLDSKGCTSPEDLGKLSRKEVELMVPSKMIHRRKLLLLTQHYRPSVNTQYHSGLSQRIRGNDSSLGTAL